jgi:hypothetical protein
MMIGNSELKEMEEALEEFQTKFEMEPNEDLWLGLVKEEREEMLKEIADYLYVSVGYLQNMTEFRQEYAGIIKEVLQALDNLCGIEVIMEAFRRVHQSNLSKLGNDGKPIRREDGKIMKGPNYEPPYLKDLI